MNTLNDTPMANDKRMSISSIRFSNKSWSDAMDDASMVLQCATEQLRTAASEDLDITTNAAIYGVLYLAEISAGLLSLGYDGARTEIHELKAKIAMVESERV